MTHVLVIDDDIVDATAVVRLLSQFRHVTTVVLERPEEAISYLAGHHVDLIISDIKMPRVDGFMLREHVMLQHPEIPVVLMTGHSQTTIRAVQSGAPALVRKDDLNTELLPICEAAGVCLSEPPDE